MPKKRKVEITPELVEDWDLDDDDDDNNKGKKDSNPKPKKAKKPKKTFPKKRTKAKKRRTISKICVADSSGTKEKSKKYKENPFGKPYSVTGNWYIATGYLQDLEQLLNLFEESEGSRFADFALCWQSLSFSLVYRGRQNFKELLEFSEEIALLTKRFLWPNYSHKKNVGALYTLYGLTYKHPLRTFFKVRLTKEEYRVIKDLVEPYRTKSDNPDPAYIFRKMEVEGALYNTASGEEHCLEFYSYEREVIDLQYQQHLMANKAKDNPLINEKQMEQDDEILKHYHEIKCKILGDGAKPEASLAMVDPNTVKEMQKIIQNTTDQNQQILDVGLCETDEYPIGNKNCIGSRRSAIRDKAIRVKPRCLYEQRDRDTQENSEEEAPVNFEEDAEVIEQQDALMEKWNQKSPGERQMKSRKRELIKNVGGSCRNILFDENIQTFMTTPSSQNLISDPKPSSKTSEGNLKKQTRKGKTAKSLESTLLDKKVQEIMTAWQLPITDLNAGSDSPVGDLNENIIKKTYKRRAQSSSKVQNKPKAKTGPDAKSCKVPERNSKKVSKEQHASTSKKDITPASAICDPKVDGKCASTKRKASNTSSKSLVSPDRRTRKNSVPPDKEVNKTSVSRVSEVDKIFVSPVREVGKSFVSPDKGVGKNSLSSDKEVTKSSLSCDKGMGESLVPPDKGVDKSSLSSDKGMGKNLCSSQKEISKTLLPDKGTSTEEGKKDKATEESPSSPKSRRKRGRPRKIERIKPEEEEANDSKLTDKSPEKNSGQYLERRKRKRERPRKYALFEASFEEEEIIQTVRPRRKKDIHLEEQIDSNGVSKEVEMTNIVRRLVHEKSPNIVTTEPDSSTIMLSEQQLQQPTNPLTVGSKTWQSSRLHGGQQNLTFSYARKNRSYSSTFADTGSTLVSLKLKVNINSLIHNVMFQMTRKKWLEVKNDRKCLDAILEKLKPHLILNLTKSKGDPSQCIIEDVTEVPGASKGRQSSSDLFWTKRKGKTYKTPNITTNGGQHMLFSYKTNEEPSCQSSPSPCQLKVVKLTDGKVVLVKPMGPESTNDVESFESGQNKCKKKKSKPSYMIIPLPPNYNVGGSGNIEEIIDDSDPLSYSCSPEAGAQNSDQEEDADADLERAMNKKINVKSVNAKEIINLEGEEFRFSLVSNDSVHSKHFSDVEEETTHNRENIDELFSSPVEEADVWCVDDNSMHEDDGLSPDEEDSEPSLNDTGELDKTLSVNQRILGLESNLQEDSPRKENGKMQKFSQRSTSVNSMPGQTSTPQKGNSCSLFVTTSTPIHIPEESRASGKEIGDDGNNLQELEITSPKIEKMQKFLQSTTMNSMPRETSTPQDEAYITFCSTGIDISKESEASGKENGGIERMENTSFQIECVSNTGESETREIVQEGEYITSDICISSKGWDQNTIILDGGSDVSGLYPIQVSESSPQCAKILEAIPVQVDFSRNPLKFEDHVSITIEDYQVMNDKGDQVESWSRAGASGRIVDTLELCQLSVNMAEMTGADPPTSIVPQYISEVRVDQGRRQTTQESSSTSAGQPVVTYTPDHVQNFIKKEVCKEPIESEVVAVEECNEDVVKIPNQVTESDPALPEPPREYKIFTHSSRMKEPIHSEAQKTPNINPKKLHQFPLSQNLPQGMPPVTETKTESPVTSKCKDTLSTPKNPVLQKSVGRTPVCSFLFSPKFKPLSSLPTCVGMATGKAQQTPRVKFFAKSYLFSRGRKSV